MAGSPPDELCVNSAPWGEKLEDLQLAIRECYGFDKGKLSNKRLVRLFEQLDVEGVGRVAVDWLISLFQPKSPVASAVRRGSITRSELSDLILSAQEEEVNRSASPLSILVCRIRDHVTLVSYSATRNGLMNLELETARRKLMVDVVNGHLTGAALRNISVGVCRLDCAMDRQKKFLAVIASSWSDAQAEPRRRCLQELLEATRACNRSYTCSSGGLAEELGPTLEAHLRRLRGAGVFSGVRGYEETRITWNNTRRDSIVEHLNSTAKSLSGRRVVLPDELKSRTGDSDDDVLSEDTETSVVDDGVLPDVQSDPASSGGEPEEPCPIRKRDSFIEARVYLDIGDPASWKEKHAARKSLWLSGKVPRDGADASTLHEGIVDELRCSHERSHEPPCADTVRKSVSFLEARGASDDDACAGKLPCAYKNGYRESFIEAREALDIGDPASWIEKHGQRKSLLLGSESQTEGEALKG